MMFYSYYVFTHIHNTALSWTPCGLLDHFEKMETEKIYQLCFQKTTAIISKYIIFLIYKITAFCNLYL